MNPIATFYICSTKGVELYSHDDKIAYVAPFVDGKVTTEPQPQPIYYGKTGKPFIRMLGGRIYLAQFIKKDKAENE